MQYRFATLADVRFLAELNHQLIRDEGHRNSMDVDQLAHRMYGWLSSGEYRAVILSRKMHLWRTRSIAKPRTKFICGNSS